MNEFISIGNNLFKIAEIVLMAIEKNFIIVYFAAGCGETLTSIRVDFESEEEAKAEFFKISQKVGEIMIDENFELAQKDIKKQIAESIDDSKHPVLMALLSKANISQFQLYEPYGIKGKRLHIKFFSPEGTIEYISERK